MGNWYRDKNALSAIAIPVFLTPPQDLRRQDRSCIGTLESAHPPPTSALLQRQRGAQRSGTRVPVNVSTHVSGGGGARTPGLGHGLVDSHLGGGQHTHRVETALWNKKITKWWVCCGARLRQGLYSLHKYEFAAQLAHP